MKHTQTLLLLLFCMMTQSLWSQALSDSAFVRQHYTKTEHQVPMRDGTKLFTIVYAPKDASDAQKYPFLMERTCYGVEPYGPNNYEKRLGYSPDIMREKYIYVYQDVRGRWMSEGTWTNMTPHIANKKTNTDIDEASDTYDTIEWLLKNIAHNNGRVGQYGTSYPGFYTVAGALCQHPALVASSPQAPVADFFFDDFHHNGAFVQGYSMTFPVFGVQKTKPTTFHWYGFNFPKTKTRDGYEWYRSIGSLKNMDKYYANNFFWQEVKEHPNYDEFWQKRSIVPHLKGVKHAIMTVGGWFDAEDLYGPLTIYKTLEKNNPNINNSIVMGPFGHGDWAREQGHHMHSNVYFGDSISTFFQREILAKFFRHHLKGPADGKTGLPEAYMFDTGLKKWKTFDKWPATEAKELKFYLRTDGKLSPEANTGASEFVSDPAKPVPYTDDRKTLFSFTPRNYMSEDQRFASERPDVLSFETEVLNEDLTLGGEIWANLNVATTGTDADWIVKLIDVYPGEEPNSPYTPKHIVLGGYQQMVRSEVMRSRFRNSFEKPEPMTANKETNIKFRLQDVMHTFKKGHKVMVQVQSTWFGMTDRNPQKYVENIYKAEDADFQKATHKVFGNSHLSVQVLK
jgi:uncharacterized protein